MENSRMGEQGAPKGDFDRLTGGAIDGIETPAFEVFRARRERLPLLIAVPHAGRAYPPTALAAMRSQRFSRLRLEDRYADLIGVRLAEATATSVIIARAPRALIDLNRARDDIDWSMIEGGNRLAATRHGVNRRSRSGLGLVPRRLHGLGEIWKRRLTIDELEARINAIHRPYHGAIAAELERIRDRWGGALLVDLHSMPPLSAARSGGEEIRFVLGDRFGGSCDAEICEAGLAFFQRRGLVCGHNRPYAGGYTLDRHGAQRRLIHALQLEICRSTYLDADLDQPTSSLDALADRLAQLVLELGEMTARLIARRSNPLHALAAE